MLLTERMERMERVQRKREGTKKKPKPLGLLAFGRKYFSHHFTNKVPDFHTELVADLQALKPGESICRIAPRGSAKSTWTTLIYPIWKAVYKQKKYIIILGDTSPNSNLFLSHIAGEFENNEKLRADFPDCRQGLTWRSEAIELTNGCRIEAMGYGRGKIRGRRHKHYRPDLILIDDPQNSEDASSPEQMQKDEQWLKSDVMNAGGPETNYIMVGTALVDECLVLQVKKNLPTWGHQTYKSLIEPPKNMHLWQKWREILWQHENPNKVEDAKKWYLQHKGDGPEDPTSMDFGAKVLWPDRVPLYELMLKKFADERAFASEHQGEPMPPGEAFFRGELFDWPGFYFSEWPDSPLIQIYGLDPSMGKEAKSGDYQAIIRIMIDRYFRYFVECWMEKLNPVQLCEFIVDRFRDNPGEAVAIEINGFQQLLEIPLKIASEKAGVSIPVYGVNNTVAKPVRIMRLARPLEAHEMFFKANSRGTQMLIDQTKKFRHPEPKGSHNDGPDALETSKRIIDKMWIGKVGE